MEHGCTGWTGFGIDSRKDAENAETGLKKNILAIFAAWREQIQRSHPAIVNDDDFFRVD